MKTNRAKTKTKKPVITVKAKKEPAKKPKKAASVKTNKKEKKVSKAQPEAKLKKTTKAVTSKKKITAKVKPSATKAKKVPTKKKPVKTAAEKTKAPAPKTLSKKPSKKKLTKKPEKTASKKIKGAVAVKVKAKVKIKTKIKAKVKAKAKGELVKKPIHKPASGKKVSEKTKTAVEVKTKNRVKTIEKKKEPSPKIKPLKQIAIPASKMSFREAAIKKQLKERSKKTTKTELKIFLPDKEQVEEIIQDVLSLGLKDEYGENDFFIMPIDPKYIFVNWEITKKAFLKARGTLNIRAYDITGITFDGNNFNRFFDININNRSGSGFFEINMQGCDVVMEIGFLQHDGRFKPMIRSNRVSIPSLMTFDELGIVLKLYEAGVPVGY